MQCCGVSGAGREGAQPEGSTHCSWSAVCSSLLHRGCIAEPCASRCAISSQMCSLKMQRFPCCKAKLSAPLPPPWLCRPPTLSLHLHSLPCHPCPPRLSHWHNPTCCIPCFLHSSPLLLSPSRSHPYPKIIPAPPVYFPFSHSIPLGEWGGWGGFGCCHSCSGAGSQEGFS